MSEKFKMTKQQLDKSLRKKALFTESRLLQIDFFVVDKSLSKEVNFYTYDYSTTPKYSLTNPLPPNFHKGLNEKLVGKENKKNQIKRFILPITYKGKTMYMSLHLGHHY
jgi:hypothetical protein